MKKCYNNCINQNIVKIDISTIFYLKGTDYMKLLNKDEFIANEIKYMLIEKKYQEGDKLLRREKWLNSMECRERPLEMHTIF